MARTEHSEEKESAGRCHPTTRRAPWSPPYAWRSRLCTPRPCARCCTSPAAPRSPSGGSWRSPARLEPSSRRACRTRARRWSTCSATSQSSTSAPRPRATWRAWRTSAACDSPPVKARVTSSASGPRARSPPCRRSAASTGASSPPTVSAASSSIHLTMEKGRRDRWDEDGLASRLVVQALADAAADADADAASVDVATPASRRSETRDLVDDPNVLGAGDSLTIEREPIVDPIEWLTSGAGDLVELTDGVPTAIGAVPPNALVLPGSFNPLHDGHRDAARRGVQRSTGMRTRVYELAVTNADKGTLPVGGGSPPRRAVHGRRRRRFRNRPRRRRRRD